MDFVGGFLLLLFCMVCRGFIYIYILVIKVLVFSILRWPFSFVG
jgi:hypothetical protein